MRRKRREVANVEVGSKFSRNAAWRKFFKSLMVCTLRQYKTVEGPGTDRQSRASAHKLNRVQDREQSRHRLVEKHPPFFGGTPGCLAANLLNDFLHVEDKIQTFRSKCHIRRSEEIFHSKRRYQFASFIFHLSTLIIPTRNDFSNLAAQRRLFYLLKSKNSSLPA